MREPFGPYLLLDRIAVGGMGEVFFAKLVRGEGFEKLVVVKRLLPHLGRNPTFVGMFQAEARIAAQLTHQNIVQIHDFGKIEEEHYIAMEAVQGVDLRALEEVGLGKGVRLPLGLALEIASQAAAGLDYAHRKLDLDGQPLHIVHRDVSPQNILVSFEGEVKLTDFGLAKARLWAAQSEAGTLKGKYSYVSPEQLLGGPVDARSDVFSMGVVLYELCTGERLFPLGESFTQTLEHIRRFDLEELSARAKGLPDSVRAALAGALAPEVAARFPTAAALREALLRARAGLAVDAAAPSLAQHVSSLFAVEVRAARALVEATIVSTRPMRTDALSLTATVVATPTTPALPSAPTGGSRSATWRLGAAVAGVVSLVAMGLWWAGTDTAGPAQPFVAAVPAREAFSQGSPVPGHFDGGGVSPVNDRISAVAQVSPSASFDAGLTSAARVPAFPRVAKAPGSPRPRATPSRAPVARTHDGGDPTEVEVPARAAEAASAPSPNLAVGVVGTAESRKAEPEVLGAVPPDGGAMTLAATELGVDVHLRAHGGQRMLFLGKAVAAGTFRRRLGMGAHLVTLIGDEGKTRTKLLVRISAGPTPNVTLNLDATPWAEVTLDGRAVGTVPIANRRLELGDHVLELRRRSGERERLDLELRSPR